jgi:hypothetical protein
MTREAIGLRIQLIVADLAVPVNDGQRRGVVCSVVFEQFMNTPIPGIFNGGTIAIHQYLRLTGGNLERFDRDFTILHRWPLPILWYCSSAPDGRA